MEEYVKMIQAVNETAPTLQMEKENKVDAFLKPTTLPTSHTSIQSFTQISSCQGACRVDIWWLLVLV